MRHTAAIREELSDFLQQIEIDNHTAIVVLSLGDPEFFDLIRKQAGDTLLASLTDIDGDILDVIKLVNFAKVRPSARSAMLDRLLSVRKLSDQDIALYLMTQAMEAGDPDFANKIFEQFPQIAKQSHLSTRNIENSSPGAGPIWQHILSGIDLTCTEISDFADNAIRQQNARATALLLKIGFPILNSGMTFMPKGGPWPDRMFQRLKSAHKRLAFLADLPDIDTIIDMDEAEARLLLGGPSKKDIQRARREARQAKQYPES